MLNRFVVSGLVDASQMPGSLRRCRVGALPVRDRRIAVGLRLPAASTASDGPCRQPSASVTDRQQSLPVVADLVEHGAGQRVSCVRKCLPSAVETGKTLAAVGRSDDILRVINLVGQEPANTLRTSVGVW
jgi:hypothetical protein